jgi:thymidine kinase
VIYIARVPNKRIFKNSSYQIYESSSQIMADARKQTVKKYIDSLFFDELQYFQYAY